MTLTSGTRLGVFELSELLGRGGMGEVYRATDTKLKRQVAIKVLPPSVATDRDRLARFQREAEVLASLNHPNIAAIYGLEESDGITALVMELVEGDDLSQRIARLRAPGASVGQAGMPLDEALPIARQIAEALEAAHEQGIIHRDLKPANIKVRSDGTVKVLDFGLAKALAPAVSKDPAYEHLTQSPTLTTPAMTQAGMILGTAAYMSPEQAKGRPTDKRTDVWAYGCVLYEMLTAQRAFDAEDVSETLAAVLRAEPEWSALPPDTPTSVVALLRRCLTKDRKRRIADISTALFVFDEPAAAAPARSAPARIDRPPLWRRALPIASTAVLVAVIAGGGGWYARPIPPAAGLVRFAILLPDGQALTNTGGHTLAVSPDGTQVVYAANQQLYIRNVAELDARAIPGTALGAQEPFFSPGGQWLGFYASTERKLKKIRIAGGASVTICDADILYGASWAADDRIVFGQLAKGILQVSANGGKPNAIFTPQSGEIVYGPQLLPGGDAVLFTLSRGRSFQAWDEARVVSRSLTTGEQRVLIEGGSDARYLPTGIGLQKRAERDGGHLVYSVGSTVLAVPFDAGTGQVIGGPVPVVDGVKRAPTSTTAAAQFSASDTGAMAYVAGPADNEERTLALVDRKGVRTPLNVPPGRPAASIRSRQTAVAIRSGRQAGRSCSTCRAAARACRSCRWRSRPSRRLCRSERLCCRLKASSASRPATMTSRQTGNNSS